MMRRLRAVLALLAWATAAAAQYPAIPESVAFDANLAYGEYKQTMLDVFYPKATAAKKRPGVVVIHGGGWTGGNKEGDWKWHVQNYVDHGFVVANVDYRLASVATAPAAVQDVLEATEYFRKNAKRWNVDTGKIVVTGGSAGGHLALMVGLAPKSAKLGPTPEVAAVVNLYGITDVEDLVQGPNERDFAKQWVPDTQDRLVLARRVSPVMYVRKGLPPVLTIHGTEDDIVPFDHATRLTKLLRDAGDDAELIPLTGSKHSPYEETQKVYPQIFEWLRKHGIANE
jgi:acetyl esterase/lipase